MKNYPTPWQVKPGLISHTLADANEVPICCLPPHGPHAKLDLDAQARCATLLSMAPALLKHLAIIVSLVRRSDIEMAMADEGPIPTYAEWLTALDEAWALVAMLTDEGITAESLS